MSCSYKTYKTYKTEEKESFKNVDIELSDEDFLVLAKIAHDRDITFNQLCGVILEEYISKEMKGNGSY